MVVKTESPVSVSRCISFPLLLSFEHQTAFVMASVRVLVRDLQNEFVWPLTRSPDDSSRLTARAVTKNLDGLTIQPPRGLGSRTSGLVEGPRPAVEVQKNA